MEKIGFVHRIKQAEGYCFIRVPGDTDYFSHVRDFKKPEMMREGQYVRFIPIPIAEGTKNPAATNVEAIAA
jgi:cold shock CspA family protein